VVGGLAKKLFSEDMLFVYVKMLTKRTREGIRPDLVLRYGAPQTLDIFLFSLDVFCDQLQSLPKHSQQDAMSKRGWTQESDAPSQQYSKRPRYATQAEELPEEIVTARHLQTLLIFDQDVPRLLDGNSMSS
jgi:hypothetical protein